MTNWSVATELFRFFQLAKNIFTDQKQTFLNAKQKVDRK